MILTIVISSSIGNYLALKMSLDLPDLIFQLSFVMNDNTNLIENSLTLLGIVFVEVYFQRSITTRYLTLLTLTTVIAAERRQFTLTNKGDG